MRGVVVVPFTPSDPTWQALAAASLTDTSVVGQRDPCIVLSDPAAYVRVGDDLGGAQHLAVMAVDFGRWGKRSSVGFAPPCGGHAKLRQRQSLQSELYAADRQRLASVSAVLLCLAGRAAVASARGKTGASEWRLNNPSYSCAHQLRAFAPHLLALQCV